MKIALAQINTTVGDFAGNVDRIVRFARCALEGRADLVIFPELALCGYPPRDLVEKPSFIARSEAELERLAQLLRGKLASDIRQVWSVGLPPPRYDMAGRALSPAEEELFAGCGVARELQVGSGNVQRTHPLRQRLQVRLAARRDEARRAIGELDRANGEPSRHRSRLSPGVRAVKRAGWTKLPPTP